MTSLSTVTDDILQCSNSTLLKTRLGFLKDCDAKIKWGHAGALFGMAKALYQWSVGFLL